METNKNKIPLKEEGQNLDIPREGIKGGYVGPYHELPYGINQGQSQLGGQNSQETNQRGQSPQEYDPGGQYENMPGREGNELMDGYVGPYHEVPYGRNQGQAQVGAPYPQGSNQGGYYPDSTRKIVQNQYNLRKFYEMPIQDKDDHINLEGKNIASKAGMGLSIFILAILASQVVIEVIILLIYPSFIKSSWYLWVVTAITIVGIGFPLYCLYMRRVPNSPQSKEKVKLKPKEFLALFFISIAFMYLTNIVGTIFTLFIALLKGEKELFNPIVDAIMNSNYFLTLIYAAVIAPIVEELIFRKILLDKLRRFGDLPAILMTGIAFGLFHLNLSQFFYATTIGFILAYITLRTNTIRYAIIIHMMINFISTALSPIILSENILAIILINLWMYGSMAIGIILFFINFKKIKLDRATIPMKKSYFILNPGTILYVVTCLFMILLVTLAS